MSKLFKLKKWLSVADAAQYLTIAFGEEVTEADMLRFALDGHLQLSVNFVNHAKAKSGQVVSWAETEWFLGPPISSIPGIQARLPVSSSSPILERPVQDTVIEIGAEINGSSIIGSPLENLTLKRDTEKILECPPKLHTLLETLMDKALKGEIEQLAAPYLRSLNIDNERYLNLSDKVVTITGVWDLSMIGNERLDIEHAYQNLTGGPEVTLQGIDGAFVHKSDKHIYQIQEDFDDNEYQPGSTARLEQLKAKIINEGIEKSEAERLLNQHKEARKKFLKERESMPESSRYYPAGGLPEDSVLVVRTEALRDFERKITETSEHGAERPLSTTERNTLLTIIGTMAKDGYGDDLSKQYPLAKEIQRAADLIGIKVSDDTIASKLKEAKKILTGRSE